MTQWKWGLGFALGLLLLGAYWYETSVSLSSNEPQQTVSVAAVASSSAGSAHLVPVQQQLTHRLQQQLDQQLPAPAADAAPAAQFIGHARRLHSAGAHISASQLEQQVLTELLRQPAQLQLAADTLVDLAVASQRFGNDQALARVYAIKLLAQQCRLGDCSTLKSTVQRLTAALEAQAAQGLPFQKAQDQDLLDLLKISMQYNDIKLDEQNLDLVLSQLGYQPTLGRQLSKIYGQTLFYALESRYGIEKARQLAMAAVNYQRFVPAAK